MPDLSLDLRNLRYALAVLEQGSFRQAAAALNLSQSTVSRRVAALEHRLGISIFDRSHRGVRLTHAGRRFVDEAQLGARHFTNAVGAMQAARRAQDGQLQIGIFTSLRNEFLRSLIGEYRRTHPAIDCHFEEGTTRQLVGGVLDGRLDVAFVTGRPESTRIEVTPLGEEHLFAALSKVVPAPEDRPLALRSLRKRRFIVTKGGRGPDVEDFLIARLSTPGFHPDVQVHDVSFESLMHMVELGFGTAVVSEGAVLRGGDIDFRALEGPDSAVISSAIRLRTNTNPALRPFLSLATRLLANQRQPDGVPRK